MLLLISIIVITYAYDSSFLQSKIKMQNVKVWCRCAMLGKRVSTLDFGIKINLKNSVNSVFSVAKKFALWQERGEDYEG